MNVGRPREHRKRDMWKNIPWEVRQQIADRIMQTPDSEAQKNRKLICKLAFIDGMSTTDIAYYCIDNNINSRNHKPYSRRRIGQIIADEVPEYNLYQVHGERAKKRKKHLQILASKEKTFCARCGRKENLELHHSIPLFLGGTDDDENLEWLCESCHREVTAYQQRTFKEKWYGGND